MIYVQSLGVCSALGSAFHDNAASLQSLMRRVKARASPFERVMVRYPQGQIGPFGLDTGQWVLGGSVLKPPDTLQEHLAELLRTVVTPARAATDSAAATMSRRSHAARWLVTLPEGRVPEANRVECEKVARIALAKADATDSTDSARSTPNRAGETA